MKSKASAILRQMVSVVGSMIKAKLMAAKGKTNAVKTKFIILGLLKSKKLFFHTLPHRIQGLLGHEKGSKDISAEGPSTSFIVYEPVEKVASADNCCMDPGLVDGDEENYPDLTHSLFEELELDSGTESVIDLVKNSRVDASSFSVEDEIDLIADVFIRRFHQKIQIQKMESFKRYQDMLNRSM